MNDSKKEEEIIKKILKKHLGRNNRAKNQLDQLSLDQISSNLSLAIDNLIQSDLKENLRPAREFILIAEQDMKDAQLLYENKSFASSIYHLQQSVEKATKACGFSVFFLNKNDLKKVQHTTPKVFMSLLNKYIILFIELTKSFNPNSTNKNLKEIEEIFYKTFNKGIKKDIAKFDENKIKTVLELSDVFKKSEKKISDFLKETIKEFIKESKDDEYKEKLKFFKSMILPKIIPYTYEFVNLYLLSIITYPHESYTRYPDQDMTPKDYTSDLGIVVMFNEITNILNSSIKALKNYLEEMNNV